MVGTKLRLNEFMFESNGVSQITILRPNMESCFEMSFGF